MILKCNSFVNLLLNQSKHEMFSSSILLGGSRLSSQNFSFSCGAATTAEMGVKKKGGGVDMVQDIRFRYVLYDMYILSC